MPGPHPFRLPPGGALPVVLLAVAGCASPAAPPEKAPRTADGLAAAWVELAFALGRHDPLYLDLVFLEEPPEAPVWALEEIRDRAGWLAEGAATGARGGEEFRVRRIAASARALGARVGSLLGERLPVRDQLRVMFGLEAKFPEPDLERLHFHVDRAVPGIAPLVVRVRRRYERRAAASEGAADLLEEALADCRERFTPATGALPLEPLRLRWLDPRVLADHPRGATPFYRYLGGGRGELELPRGLALARSEIGRLACHEGVPGHHLQAAVADAHFRATGWAETGIVPLYDPRTAVFEGLAATMERLAPASPEEEALRALEPLVARILARYLDGELERLEAMRALDFEALTPDPHPVLAHADRFGAYALVRPSTDPMFAAALEPLADPSLPAEERLAAITRVVQEAMSPRELVEVLSR